ncbi:MAG: PHP domain-containing protein [Clostridiales bacterium]|nr:PHP domain-containing protein [Clostridiales bacterium]
MKKYLLPENGQFYKANLHCHTTVSDGKLTPEQVKKAYMDHGYSIVAYTDHNVLLDHQDLTDENFVALNGFEIDLGEGPMPDRERKCCHICMVALSPDNLTQVCYHREKYVWGNAANYRPQLKVDDSPDFERRYTAECINEVMKTGREKGFFVTYNHPAWSFETYPDYTAYQNMHAMEIVNYGCFNAGYNDYAPEVYDEMLRYGKCGKIYCVATDDNHNGAPLTSMRCDSFGGFTMIKTDKLDYKSITDALVKGNFYASQGPKIYSLVYEDRKLKIETSDAESIFFTTGKRRTGVVQNSVMGDTVNYGEFEVRDTDIYVRVTVVSKDGKHACTNAYFVDDLLKD